MTNYQKRVLSDLFTCFGYEPFTAWGLADLVESPYGNACATIRGLACAGKLIEVAPKQYAINPKMEFYA